LRKACDYGLIRGAAFKVVTLIALVMVQKELRVFAEYYDQIYLKRNDYKVESEFIKKIVKKFERKPSRTLLDVGCGTGEHLRYLSRAFRCKGIDISREMIKTAKAKVVGAEFKVADMMDFDLGEKFDVVTCLFSSIGYVQTFENLVTTLKNFRMHLGDEGLTLVEPWVFKKDFREGSFSIDTFEDDRVKLVRMGTSKLSRSCWSVCFHYLIGKDGKIKHAQEIHKMLVADYEDYVKAFDWAGYGKAEFLKGDSWTRSRGLFVAME
jgi:SAM-dependent methyltransferase